MKTILGLPFKGISGLAHTLFGIVLLGALWVTSLTLLSARPTAWRCWLTRARIRSIRSWCR